MSQVSQAFYDKIERWMLGGLDINRMSMSDDQKYRAMVVYEHITNGLPTSRLCQHE